MDSPKSTYTQNLERYNAELKTAHKKLLRSSLLRLIVFLSLILAVYLLWGHLRLIALSVVAGLVLFFFLVNRHVNLKYKRDRIKALIDINQTELAVLSGEFNQLPQGLEYRNDGHEFSRDLDLFGNHSFFQYANRAALKEGEKLLAEIFTKNAVDAIEKKQEAVKELSKKIDFRQEYSAQAKLSTAQQEQNLSIQRHLEGLQNHKFFTPKFSSAISWFFSIISIGMTVAFFSNLIAFIPLLIWFFIGLIITSLYVKRVNLLSHKVTELQHIFRQHHKLLHLIEETSFSAELLQANKKRVATKQKSASQILKEFSRTIDALDQRNNLLFGFLGNGFLLWDLRQSAKLEQWMNAYAPIVNTWFETAAFFDAYNSLGNFAYNHPNYTYPKINKDSTLIQTEQAVHPLIPEKEAVTNDYTIEKEAFFIVTGANMAGKSTFLRTVALQIVMSNIGLPVRAASCVYAPIKLITSMRTVDSLAEEASYFYAELSRLKFIIDRLKDENYFIVLDEILKGTNSTDKALGSRKFLEKLVGSHSTGIIATHDLSLCETAEEHPNVKNYYFDAQIINDELYFDYKFKTGICQNMNASFLLRKMEIVDD